MAVNLTQLLNTPWHAFNPDDWEKARPSARVEGMKKRLLECEHQIDVERARLTTHSYRLTEGMPMPVRRARMLMYLVEQMSISIEADELIVGNRSLLPRMGVIAPEGAVNWVDTELDILSIRPQDRFNIQPNQIDELRQEIFPYWRGKTLEDQVKENLPEDVKAAIAGKVFNLNQTDHAQGHILPDVTSWLSLGISGLREKINTARQNPKLQNRSHQTFYEAAGISLQAAEILMSRYGHLARQEAHEMQDTFRAAELTRIADTCIWLSANPPRDFYEALQSTWFLFVLLQIESNASSFSPGRFDQYMLPYLKADLEKGIHSLEEAQDLINHLWLKFNQIVLLRNSKSARYFAGFPIGFNLILGGQVSGLDGSLRDATNFLSYMCLRAQAEVGLTQPNLSIRIHQDSPSEFLEAASAVIGKGSGMPQVFNDEVIIPAQIRRNISPQDAYNYAVVGCVELSTPGKALGWSDAAMFNMARILELTLFGGRDPQSGKQIGLPISPLEQMKRFTDFETAYDQQLVHFVDLMIRGCRIVDRIHAEVLPSPFLSLVIDACLENGLDVTDGGAIYNFSGVQGVQIANVADSMAAVQQAVFEGRWLSPSDLLNCLRKNFEGQESLRQRLIGRVPKFGNDDAQVDNLAAKWANRYSELVEGYSTIRGGVYTPGFYTVSAHVPMGADVGATPDGRRAGEPLADGGLSPSAGRDRKGPTAVLNSVSAINLALASNGTLLNMKFLPSFFQGKQSLEKFAAFLRCFCSSRIPHIQFNVVSVDTLRQAQVNPDQYRHLVIRVAGYSAYFTQLDRDLQEEIIRRTEYPDTL